MSGFEPPKYIASLIQAINDGAKTAQTGLVAVAALGVYLLAVAFATTDDELLLNHTTNIAQFGVQLSPRSTFGIAPLLFVAFHVFTVIRYDMLGTNVRHLTVELEKSGMPEADRERCRQLLVNVEFIVAMMVPRTSPLHSKIFGPVFCLMIAAFPLAVLLSEEISALRYQNNTILWLQRFAVLADILLLIWFFRRNAISGSLIRRGSMIWLLHWSPFVMLPVAFAVNLFWLYNLGSTSTRSKLDEVSPPYTWRFWQQPFDHYFCPVYSVGCGYLSVQGQVFYRSVLPDSVAKLREATGFDRSKDLNQVMLIGTYLGNRSLNYVHLNDSEFYNPLFNSASMVWASMVDVRAPGADFSGATLSHINFHYADLADTDFTNADLSYADLTGANLSDANFLGANMTGVTLDQTCYDSGTVFPADFGRKVKGLVLIDKGKGCPGTPY